jgi:hypothetical protein
VPGPRAASRSLRSNTNERHARVYRCAAFCIPDALALPFALWHALNVCHAPINAFSDAIEIGYGPRAPAPDSIDEQMTRIADI